MGSTASTTAGISASDPDLAPDVTARLKALGHHDVDPGIPRPSGLVGAPDREDHECARGVRVAQVWTVGRQRGPEERDDTRLAGSSRAVARRPRWSRCRTRLMPNGRSVRSRVSRSVLRISSSESQGQPEHPKPAGVRDRGRERSAPDPPDRRLHDRHLDPEGVTEGCPKDVDRGHGDQPILVSRARTTRGFSRSSCSRATIR